jgi:hypothetical protein
MKNKAEKVAGAIASPMILRGFRLRWLVYGAAAYFGLRMLSKSGIFQKQADAALDVIDKGVDMVKEQVGLTPSPTKGVEHQADLRH